MIVVLAFGFWAFGLFKYWPVQAQAAALQFRLILSTNHSAHNRAIVYDCVSAESQTRIILRHVQGKVFLGTSVRLGR